MGESEILYGLDRKEAGTINQRGSESIRPQVRLLCAG